MIRRPPRSTLFPYTRSSDLPRGALRIPFHGPQNSSHCQGVVAPREAMALLPRSEEHTSELQSQSNLVCRLLLEKKKKARNAARCVVPLSQPDELVEIVLHSR